jgi:hypothetical protein
MREATMSESGSSRALGFIAREFRHVIPPTLFFAAGFNLVVLSMNLVLADYLIQIGGFLVATTSALIVGKAVLVADNMPFLRRFDTAPLIRPILFKTMVYWSFVFVARLLEAFVHFVVETGGVQGFGAFVAAQFSWHRFLFIQIWILVLFLVYASLAELNTLFGDGELYRLLFKCRTTELKLTRRQRIRTLVQLSRLTEAHRIDELRDPRSRAHGELVAMIQALADRTSRPALLH